MGPLRRTARGLSEGFRSLGESPRELWLIYAAKFFESVGIFSTLLMLTLWLSSDLGYSDQGAGWWAGTFSLALSAMTFFIGFFADWLGFRRALIIGFCCSVVARGCMSIATTRASAISALMFLSIGMAAGVPIMNTAVRRYTTENNRSFAFSIYYVMMNVGSFASGQLIDRVRTIFRHPSGKGFTAKTFHIPGLGPHVITANKAIFAVGFGCALIALAIAFTLRASVDLEAPVEERSEPGDGYRDKVTVQVPKPEAKKGPFGIMLELLREKPFWRFMLFVGLLSLVRMIFIHYKFTWPKYVLREMGETFPIGKVYAFNPVLIIILVPLVTALTRKKSAFSVIVVGSFVSALSVFVLCFGASYYTILGMILMLSIGEALWSPRLYEYTAIIAPRGRESSYMGLSSLPMFLAKMAVGPMSGYLLAHYCPETGPRHSSTMWLIIGLMTLSAPVMVVLLRGAIEGKTTPPEVKEAPIVA